MDEFKTLLHRRKRIARTRKEKKGEKENKENKEKESVEKVLTVSKGWDRVCPPHPANIMKEGVLGSYPVSQEVRGRVGADYAPLPRRGPL